MAPGNLTGKGFSPGDNPVSPRVTEKRLSLLAGMAAPPPGEATGATGGAGAGAGVTDVGEAVGVTGSPPVFGFLAFLVVLLERCPAEEEKKRVSPLYACASILGEPQIGGMDGNNNPNCAIHQAVCG